MPSIRSGSLTSVLLSLLCSNVALAGPVERLAEIAVHPSNPDVIALSYINGGTGLLVSSDGGHEFRLLCSAVIDTTRPKGPITITNDGRMLLGEFNGVWQDNGSGCGWSAVSQVSGRWLTDFAVHPSDPGRIFSVSANGGAGVRNGLVRRDAPDTWVEVGSRDELGISRIRVAKVGSGLRFYQSALRVPDATGDGGVAQPNYLVRVSDDEGQSWRENEVEIEGIGSLRLEAIDPTNPDRILATIARDNKPDTLLVSRDQGRTFEPYLELTDLGGITLAPDGRVFVGEPASLANPDASRGLWYAANLDAKPTKVAEFGVECLYYQPQNQTLLACQASAFGKVDTTSWMFTQYSHFTTVKDFVSCSDKVVADVCQPQLCADYCGAAHFAKAPVCCAYNTDSCGPAVAKMEGTGGPEMCTMAAAAGRAGSAAGKAGSAAATAGTAAMPRQAGAPAQAGAGGNMQPPDPMEDDGCGCRALGADGRKSSGRLAIPLLILALVATRRRRRS